MQTSSESLLPQCRALAAASAWGDLCRLVETALEDAGRTPALITLYAEALLRRGNARAARGWLDDHAAVVTLSGDRAAIRRVVNLTGAASFELSDLERAEVAFERCLELGRNDGDDLLVARATNNLAVIATIRGRHLDALGLYGMAIPVYQRLGNVNGIAETYHNTAIALRKVDRLEQADDHERRAAEFARQVKNEHLVALTLVGRAEISLLRGDAALAEATATFAARELGTVPDPSRQADAIRLCGTARYALGKFAEARESLNDAVALAADSGSALIEAESRWARAQVAKAMGDHASGLDDAERAAAIFGQLDAPAEFTSVTEWITSERRQLS
jgi:tetratricopeptide (TPR) repeat protein